MIFEEPAPSRSGGGFEEKYLPWVVALADHPGRWVKWPEEMINPSATASSLKRRYPGIEAVGRVQSKERSPKGSRKNGYGYLYARYVGGGK